MTMPQRQSVSHRMHIVRSIILLFLGGTLIEASKLKGSKRVGLDARVNFVHARVLQKQIGSSYFSDFGYTKDGFESACLDYLSDAARDGMLSQFDYSDFLYAYCHDSPYRGPSCSTAQKGTSFQSLPINLQLNFIGSRCPVSNIVASLECLQYLNDSKQDFGYSEETSDLCTSSYPLMLSSGLLGTELYVDGSPKPKGTKQDNLNLTQTNLPPVALPPLPSNTSINNSTLLTSSAFVVMSDDNANKKQPPGPNGLPVISNVLPNPALASKSSGPVSNPVAFAESADSVNLLENTSAIDLRMDKASYNNTFNKTHPGSDNGTLVDFLPSREHNASFSFHDTNSNNGTVQKTYVHRKYIVDAQSNNSSSLSQNQVQGMSNNSSVSTNSSELTNTSTSTDGSEYNTSKVQAGQNKSSDTISIGDAVQETTEAPVKKVVTLRGRPRQPIKPETTAKPDGTAFQPATSLSDASQAILDKQEDPHQRINVASTATFIASGLVAFLGVISFIVAMKMRRRNKETSRTQVQIIPPSYPSVDDSGSLSDNSLFLDAKIPSTKNSPIRELDKTWTYENSYGNGKKDKDLNHNTSSLSSLLRTPDVLQISDSVDSDVAVVENDFDDKKRQNFTSTLGKGETDSVALDHGGNTTESAQSIDGNTKSSEHCDDDSTAVFTTSSLFERPLRSEDGSYKSNIHRNPLRKSDIQEKILFGPRIANKRQYNATRFNSEKSDDRTDVSSSSSSRGRKSWIQPPVSYQEKIARKTSDNFLTTNLSNPSISGDDSIVSNVSSQCSHDKNITALKDSFHDDANGPRSNTYVVGSSERQFNCLSSHSTLTAEVSISQSSGSMFSKKDLEFALQSKKLRRVTTNQSLSRTEGKKSENKFDETNHSDQASSSSRAETARPTLMSELAAVLNARKLSRAEHSAETVAEFESSLASRFDNKTKRNFNDKVSSNEKQEQKPDDITATDTKALYEL